jgi:ADP-ribosylation factor-like protein 3
VRNDVSLNLWDLGGQRTIRTYWNQYYENTGALVYVIDSTDEDRMEEAGSELQKMLNDGALQRDIPILVLANKQDLMNSLSVQEISSVLQLADIQNRPWHIQPCSAKTGEGIEEGFDFLVPFLNK